MLCLLKILLDKLYAPSQNYHLKPWLRFPAQLLLQKLPVIHPTGACIFKINRKVKLQETITTRYMSHVACCGDKGSNEIQELLVTKCPSFL